uniref:HAT C-terminal dimerisation domain-containing protein n=1 Tax=Romanomermis culicivorax TaxID=13658 RepID=A0A915IY85_ROMCU
MQYWLTEGKTWSSFQKIALKVFSILVPTASPERNCATFGFVHTKLHNRLLSASVEKLVFLKFKAKIFFDGAE